MYSLIVAGQPMVPFMLMITEGLEAKQVEQVTCFYPGLVGTMKEIFSKYDINSITVYGARTYMTHIYDVIVKNFPNRKVKLACAGEE